MQIRVNRFGYGSDSTVGRLYVDDMPLMYTLEDEVRDGPKVPGETAIPAGYIYDVTPRTTGGMTQRYAERFPDLHRGMAWLRDVPGFSYVYIHIGNTDDDTEGCLLVGYNYRESDSEFTVSSSTDAYVALYKLIAEAWAREERVTVEVQDT